MNNVKYCKHCKFFLKKDSPFADDKCLRDAEHKLKIDYVNGENKPYIDNYHYSFHERKGNGENRCGPEGKFYKENRLFVKLLNWVKSYVN